MTVNDDKEIDVLLGRYVKGAAKGGSVDHLDADELSAFAEGKLPAAARQQYVSHLADCDDCRRIATQLAMAAGAAADVRVAASQPAAESWWKNLSALFAPATLRYAAFAVVLLAVVGVAFLVWRRPPATKRDADLIAQHQPQTNPSEALKPAGSEGEKVVRNSKNEGTPTTAMPQPTVSQGSYEQKPESSGVSPAPPPKPGDAVTEKEAPVIAAKAPEAPRADSSPAYAPAPSAEGFQMANRSREQQNVGGAMAGGPRRNESFEKDKALGKSADVAKAPGEDRFQVANQPTAAENKQDDNAARARTSSGLADERGRDLRELRSEDRKREATVTSEEAPATRSVGGRRFKRQGNAWVDAKFKSSMSTRNVARGSEDFEKLDSGLRSIANQLSGEVIVVWKGKAYRIR